MTPSIKQRFGAWGERLAVQHLEAHGYTILARNLRTPYGELDIIASQAEMLVFVEVKTRSSAAFGYPEEALTPTKQAHLLNAASAYMQAHPELPANWRIDVIAILQQPKQLPQIIQYENVITT